MFPNRCALREQSAQTDGPSAPSSAGGHAIPKEEMMPHVIVNSIREERTSRRLDLPKKLLKMLSLLQSAKRNQFQWPSRKSNQRIGQRESIDQTSLRTRKRSIRNRDITRSNRSAKRVTHQIAPMLVTPWVWARGLLSKTIEMPLQSTVREAWIRLPYFVAFKL